MTSKRSEHTKTPKQVWDVIVVGGGAAGMMAAGTAAANGAKVLLLEKNPKLGQKLLITGGGRSNITNAEFDTHAFLSKFSGSGRKDDQYLFSAFAKWNVQDTLDFFTTRGMDTKVEALKRVFPVSNSAQSVWDVLVANMQEHGVAVRTRVQIRAIHHVQEKETGGSTSDKNSTITSIELVTGEQLHAHAFIFATGGKSRPETGSTGDGFVWLKELGHTISESGAALVPLTLKDTWAKDLAGVSLKPVVISVEQEAAKKRKVRGTILFTHKGITGPTILNLSKDIGESLKYGPVTLTVDLIPDVTREKLSEQLHLLLQEKSNRLVKNVLSELVPSALVSSLLMLVEIPEDTFSHSLTREKRLALLALLKALPLHVKGLLGLDKAVITSGGVSLKEIDFKTMQSRLIKNLYVVGDLLDLDRPSGGYSLQLCWTTGAVAGTAAAQVKTQSETLSTQT